MARLRPVLDRKCWVWGIFLGFLRVECGIDKGEPGVSRLYFTPRAVGLKLALCSHAIHASTSQLNKASDVEKKATTYHESIGWNQFHHFQVVMGPQ